MTAGVLKNCCKGFNTADFAKNGYTFSEARDSGLCVGYMLGYMEGSSGCHVVDGVMYATHVGENGTPEYASEVFVLYMNNHPERENEDACRVLFDCLIHYGLLAETITEVSTSLQ